MGADMDAERRARIEKARDMWRSMDPKKRERIGAAATAEYFGVGAYAPAVEATDAMFNGLQASGAWVDEASDPAFFETFENFKAKPTPCIPDSAFPPVIDWMHRPPPPLSIRLVRAVALVAVLAVLVAGILS